MIKILLNIPCPLSFSLHPFVMLWLMLWPHTPLESANLSVTFESGSNSGSDYREFGGVNLSNDVCDDEEEEEGENTEDDEENIHKPPLR